MSSGRLLRKWSRISGICVVLAGISVAYVNCGEGGGVSATSTNTDLVIPDPLCGYEGYTFIMDNYFTKFCTGCHTKTGFNPKFADPSDMALSYSITRDILRSKLLETITNNGFCRNEGCNLDTEDPLYKAIDQWTTMRFACP